METDNLFGVTLSTLSLVQIFSIQVYSNIYFRNHIGIAKQNRDINMEPQDKLCLDDVKLIY